MRMNTRRWRSMEDNESFEDLAPVVFWSFSSAAGEKSRLSDAGEGFASSVDASALGGPFGSWGRDERCTVRGRCQLMLGNYFPVLLFLVMATLFGLIGLAAGFTLGPRRPDREKLSPYECGFEAFEDARGKFDVRFYLVAILFILFRGLHIHWRG